MVAKKMPWRLRECIGTLAWSSLVQKTSCVVLEEKTLVIPAELLGLAGWLLWQTGKNIFVGLHNGRFWVGNIVFVGSQFLNLVKRKPNGLLFKPVIKA